MSHARNAVAAAASLLLAATSFAAPATAPVKGPPAGGPAAATVADRSAVTEVTFGGIEANAPIVPDPEAKPPRPVVGRPVVMAGGTDDFFEHDPDLLFSGGEVAVVAVCHELNEKFAVERIDLTAGRSLNTVKMPSHVKAMDLSLDGKRLLWHTVGDGFGKSDRVEVTAVEANAPRAVLGFVPFDDAEGPGRDVAWGRFTSDGHVVTLSGEGRLVVWDEHAKAVWAASLPRFARLAMSPNHKYLAAPATEDTIAVLDAANGKTLATFATPPTPPGLKRAQGASLAFRPDGKQLAASTENALCVYDLTTGKQADELYPAIPGEPGLTWCGDGYVLAGGSFVRRESYLVSLEKKVVVWQYVPTQFRRCDEGVYFAGRYWYTAKAQPPAKGTPVLVGAALPGPAELAAVAKAPPPEMVIHPGLSVSLQVDLPEDIKSEVTDALKAELQRNGLAVAEGQPIKLVASTEQGKAREMNYVPAVFAHLPGSPESKHATKVSVNELISRLAFVGTDGKSVWEREDVRLPPAALRFKKDQSVADAVAEAMKPTPNFFKDTSVPKMVPKGSDEKGLGTSTLTAQGVVPPAAAGKTGGRGK